MSTQLPWRWEGVLHEHLEAGYPVAQRRVPGFWTTVNSDGARSGDPQKSAKDAAVLAASVQDEPGNSRYMFYLAQSGRDAGQPEQALATYLRGLQEWHTAYPCAQAATHIPLPNDRLFVDVTAYHWRAPDELALAAFHTGRQDEPAKLWEGLLAGPHLPAADRARIEANLGFALKK